MHTETMMPLERDVILSALIDYRDDARQRVEYCGIHDMPDLARMWEARQECAEEMLTKIRSEL